MRPRTKFCPPGVVNLTGPITNSAKGYHMSWLVQILPYLEQRNAYNKTNFSLGVYDDANSTVRMHRIMSFLCPSSSSSRSQSANAPTDYAACHHDFEAPIDVTNNGVFYLNSNTRLDDVKDGTSCTIFVGEKKPLPARAWAGCREPTRPSGTWEHGSMV